MAGAAAASTLSTLRPYVPILQRFPKCYRQFLEDLKRPRTPVNFIPTKERFYWDEHRERAMPVIDEPIPIIYPPESQTGLWAGEGAVQGYRPPKPKLKRNKTFVPKFWFPHVKSVVVYSEILDKYLKMQVTLHALEEIDKNFGLDMYLLKTPVQDINSQLGFDLRRKLLLALARKEIYPNDPKRREEILAKYAEFIIPEEEAEWFGLSIREATWKLLEQEQSARGTPMKYELRAKYIAKLKAAKEASSDAKDPAKADP